MKLDRHNLAKKARNGAGKALMVMSLVGMMGMSVSAANGRELNEISNDVSITNYGINLNAAGYIEYDATKDGKNEVYYDYKDYQRLGTSLSTIDKNETELKNEYTRLYNLAESNRKDLIHSWNRYGIPQLALGENANYVSGNGTASIKGAMDTMPVHKFSDIRFNYDSRTHTASITYPDPWGGVGVYNGGQLDQNALNQMLAEAYQQGLQDGKTIAVNEIVSSVEQIRLWDGVASADRASGSWDDAAGSQTDGKEVFLEDGTADKVADKALDYVRNYAKTGSALRYIFSVQLPSWSKNKISSQEYYEYTYSTQSGCAVYTGHIRVARGDVDGHKIGNKDKYHISNVYVTISASNQ